MKKKLLYIVNVDTFFLSHRIDIAKKAKKYFTVHIATKFTTNKNYFKNQGMFTHDLFINRSSFGFISNLISCIHIIWLIIKIRPDLIHFVSIKPVLLGGIVSRFYPNISKIFSITGLGYVFTQKDYFSKIRRSFFIYLYKIALNQKNYKIIFQNLYDVNILKKSIPQKKNVELIPGSGVSLSRYKPKAINLSNPTIMFASRMLIHKGIYEFIEAVKILKREGCNAKYVLVGNVDPYNFSSISLSEIENWVKCGLVEYWGHKNNMNKILSLATILVLPSYREGFPKILMEAASCGRPVITTNVPGCKNAITNKTGVLVPCKNSKYLAKAIKNLLKNKNKIIKMGIQSRKHAVKNFDIQNIINKNINIYKNLINK